jgi:hypothetical protein
MARPVSQAKLANLAKRRQKLNEMNVSIAYQNALIENEGAIIEFIQQQMLEGITGNEEPITLYGYPEYSPEYARFKKRATGQRVDIINLHLYGEFYNQMYTTAKGDTYTVRSAVPYFDKIIGRSGAEVMKMTPGNFESFLELFVNPEVRRVVNEALSI